MNGLKRILFVQKREAVDGHETLIRHRLQSGLDKALIEIATSPDEIEPGPYAAVIAPTLPWLDQVLARTGPVPWVHFLSSGVEKIWSMPIDWSNTALSRSAGIHGPQMSEYVIGALLHFTKSFDHFIEQSRNARWQRHWLDELTGRNMVILGAGAIAKAVAQRARAFDMRVTAVTRRPRDLDWADAVISVKDLRQHCGGFDAMVVCLPLTDQTQGLVDREILDRLDPGGIVVDISRGGVVVTDDMIARLNSGHLRGAALDVFPEQPLSASSPVWNRPDILVTPHVSGTSPHYLPRALDLFIENATAWFERGELVTPVDRALGY